MNEGNNLGGVVGNIKNLTDEEKLLLIDQLLSDLGVDNFGSTYDASNRCSYHSLYRNGEKIGKVLIKHWDEDN